MYKVRMHKKFIRSYRPKKGKTMNDIVIETLDTVEEVPFFSDVEIAEAASLVPTEGDVTVAYVQEAPEGEAVA